MTQTLLVLTVVGVALVIGVWFLVGSVRVVPQWARLVVFRFGRTGPGLVFQPGLRVTLPVVDRCFLVDLREQTVKLPRQTVFARDGAAMGVDIQIRYQIIDALESQLRVYNFRESVEGSAADHLRNSVGLLDAKDVPGRRTRIADELQSKLATEVAEWGGKIVKVEIGDIGPAGLTSLGGPVVAR